MPFKSEKQRRYLWANEPEIARDWTDTYGSRIQKNSGGISQLVKPGPGRPGYAGVLDKNIANLETALKHAKDLGMSEKEIEQIKADLKKAKEAKGTWKDKALSGDPVKDPAVKEKAFPRKTNLQGSLLEAMGVSSMSPHKGMSLNPQDREALLAKLLESDPASDVYDYSKVAAYDEDPLKDQPYRQQTQAGTLGYYTGDKAYVKNLDKLGNVPGKYGETDLEKMMAATTGHELTHDLLESEPFRNIREGIDLPAPREQPYNDYVDGTYMPHEPEELLVRLLDLQRYGEYADPEWYFEQSPYAQSLHPSGEYGLEGLKKTISRHSDKFYNRVDERKNYLRQQNAMQQMMNDPLGKGLPTIEQNFRRRGAREYDPNWKTRIGNRIGNWRDKMGQGISAAWSGLTGFPGMALNAFRGQQLTPQQQAMNNQFFQNYNVGIGTQQNPFQMTSGPFQGMNAPGMSAYGSPTSQAMAQKWLGKYGDVDHYSQAMKDKKQTMLDLASVNTVNPVGGVDQIAAGPGDKGQHTTQGTSTPTRPGGWHPGVKEGGLISLWPR